ncbi:MAG: hypothetical protein ACPIOQ_85090, partial [Promethearchaeia archaeon]
RGLIKIKNAFCVCECVGALGASDGPARMRVVPHAGTVFDVERDAWDTAHVLWSDEAVRAASAQSKSWHNAMKSKAKLKALDDAVAAWRMLYAPSEGALGDGGEEGEGSDAEVSDNAANAGYDE